MDVGADWERGLSHSPRNVSGGLRPGVRAYATGCYYRGDDVRDWKSALPVLRDDAHYAEWAAVLSEEFDALKDRASRGNTSRFSASLP